MIDQNELNRGIEIEKEHTQDVALARKIALDHLVGNKSEPGDPRYYSKLKAAGLDETDECATCGCGDPTDGHSGPIGSPAVDAQPKALVVKIGGAGTGQQQPLSSSGLGKAGVPKPLGSTHLKAPETQVVNDKNTVVVGKTPPIVAPADPLDHFYGKIGSMLGGDDIDQ